MGDPRTDRRGRQPAALQILSCYNELCKGVIREEGQDLARTIVCVLIMLIGYMIATPVYAEELGTRIQANARADLSGRTELLIHKTYAGQLGPVRDIISMQGPDPMGYPKVEIAASGAVRATREPGGIIVESTGPGPGTINVLVTFDRLQSTWWLQVADAPGVGEVELNASVWFGNGLHAARQGNHVIVQTAGEKERRQIKDYAHRQGWSAEAKVPAGSMILLEMAGEPDRVAPLWLAQVGLGLALVSLALAGHLAMKLRRAAS